MQWRTGPAVNVGTTTIVFRGLPHAAHLAIAGDMLNFHLILLTPATAHLAIAGDMLNFHLIFHLISHDFFT